MSSQLAEAPGPQQSHFFNFFGGGSNLFKAVHIDKFHCQLVIFREKTHVLKKYIFEGYGMEGFLGNWQG